MGEEHTLDLRTTLPCLEVHSLSDSNLRQLPHYQHYMWIAVMIWTVALVGSAIWNIRGVNEGLIEDARLQALVAFEKDIHYRRWNADHGGVYVKVSPIAEPNPYLAGIAERDKRTLEGDSLTMINPAFMTRQLHEIELLDSGIRGHITSLNPIRPENKADDWEVAALKQFEKGKQEITSVEYIGDTEYFRFMRPLITEQTCLPCHHQQGYQEGDVRGGISISIPLQPLRASANKGIYRISLAHFYIWLTGSIGAVLSILRIRVATHKKYEADRQLELSERQYRALAKELKESNDVQELLLDIITHDLRNPAGVIQSISVILKKEIPENEMIELIRTSSIRLIEVMENAKALAQASGGEQLETQVYSLTTIINDVAKGFSRQFQEAKMILQVDITSELLVVVHPIISEVFVNYLSNVIKYGGNTEYVIIDAEEDANSITIRVRDQGDTIPEADRQKIFNRSVQLSTGEKRGRGLGLSIVRRIAEALGGEVWVEPNLPSGNSFCLRLPQTQESAST